MLNLRNMLTRFQKTGHSDLYRVLPDPKAELRLLASRVLLLDHDRSVVDEELREGLKEKGPAGDCSTIAHTPMSASDGQVMEGILPLDTYSPDDIKPLGRALRCLLDSENVIVRHRAAGALFKLACDECADAQQTFLEMLDSPDEQDRLIATCAISGNTPQRKVVREYLVSTSSNPAIAWFAAELLRDSLIQYRDVDRRSVMPALEGGVRFLDGWMQEWAAVRLCLVHQTYHREFEPLFIRALSDQRRVQLCKHVLSFFWEYWEDSAEGAIGSMSLESEEYAKGLGGPGGFAFIPSWPDSTKPRKDSPAIRDAVARCLGHPHRAVRRSAAQAIQALASAPDHMPIALSIAPPAFYGGRYPSAFLGQFVNTANDIEGDPHDWLLGPEDPWEVYEKGTGRTDHWSEDVGRAMGFLALHNYHASPERDIVRALARIHWATETRVQEYIEQTLQFCFPDTAADLLKFKIAVVGQYHLVRSQPDSAAVAVLETSVYQSIRDTWIRIYLSKLPRFVRRNESDDIARKVDWRFVDKCRRGSGLARFDPSRHKSATAWLSTVIRKLVVDGTKKLRKTRENPMPFVVEQHADAAPGPHETAAIVELIGVLNAKLGATKLNLLMQRDGHHDSFPEIAKRLGMTTADNARVSYNRIMRQAIEHLRKIDY